MKITDKVIAKVNRYNELLAYCETFWDATYRQSQKDQYGEYEQLEIIRLQIESLRHQLMNEVEKLRK